MTGYRRRAAFYRSEFAVRDDFALLGQLLAGEDGLVIDIPSGAGRLMPVHQAHRRQVIMVDTEPAMTGQCRRSAADCGISRRVTAVQGDITTWQPPAPAALVIVARGGLQMLTSQEDVARALTVSVAGLAASGILYLDMAMPWTAAPDTAPHLAPFLRFAGSTRLEGSSIIDAGDGLRIRRSYISTLQSGQVTARFHYQAVSGPAGDWADFETETSWLRIEPAGILAILRGSGLAAVRLLGDYSGTPYETGSARFICIAAA